MNVKGEKEDRNNYRSINLLNCTLILTTKILTTKINARIQLEEEQQEFRSERSCTDAVFIMIQVKEKSIEYNILAYLCLIDLKKAFNNVQTEDIIRLLFNRNISLDLIKTIANIYKDYKVVERLAEGMTEPINYESGIRLGGSLSPLLFNIVVDEIIKNVERRKGYRMSNREPYNYMLCRWRHIMAETENDLQRLLYEFCIAGKQYNMSISTEKTKTIIIAKEPIR